MVPTAVEVVAARDHFDPEASPRGPPCTARRRPAGRARATPTARHAARRRRRRRPAPRASASTRRHRLPRQGATPRAFRRTTPADVSTSKTSPAAGDGTRRGAGVEAHRHGVEIESCLAPASSCPSSRPTTPRRPTSAPSRPTALNADVCRAATPTAHRDRPTAPTPSSSKVPSARSSRLRGVHRHGHARRRLRAAQPRRGHVAAPAESCVYSTAAVEAARRLRNSDVPRRTQPRRFLRLMNGSWLDHGDRGSSGRRRMELAPTTGPGGAARHPAGASSSPLRRAASARRDARAATGRSTGRAGPQRRGRRRVVRRRATSAAFDRCF